MKVRFVVCGYEDLHNLKTDSPTCSRELMRLVMLTVSLMQWKILAQRFCKMVFWEEKYFLDHT